MAGLPKLGLGTSQNTDPEECAASVETALEVGYRHIDTAQMYNNEELVGHGVARADVDRDDICIATKVDEGNYEFEQVIETTHESRERLGVDVIDLLYVHWPTTNYDPEETLPAFDHLRDDGVVRHVGVSNFSVEQMEAAIDILDAPLAANQVEIHPLLPPDTRLLEAANRNDVQLVAYSPFCRTEAFGHEPIPEIAEKHGVSQAQVILSWLWSHEGIVAIPKGSSREHIVDNYDARTLELDPEDIERIGTIEERRRFVDRPGAHWNQ